MESYAPMPDWFFWSFGIAMAVMFASWLVFGRLTTARIEREIRKDGLPRPCPWDGPGARIVWYAWAIALPVGRFNRLDDPMIDVSLVRRYATRIDRVIATVMVISSAAFLLVGIAGSILE